MWKDICPERSHDSTSSYPFMGEAFCMQPMWKSFCSKTTLEWSSSYPFWSEALRMWELWEIFQSTNQQKWTHQTMQKVVLLHSTCFHLTSMRFLFLVIVMCLFSISSFPNVQVHSSAITGRAQFPLTLSPIQRHPRFHISIHNSRVCKTWEFCFPLVGKGSVRGPQGFSHFLSAYHS